MGTVYIGKTAMAFRRFNAALVLVALASCAEGAPDLAGAMAPANQCFSLSAAQAVDLSTVSALRVQTSDGLFELELSGDCATLSGPPIAVVEAGSSSPFCVGQSAGRELIVRHPVTQQSGICRVEAVRLFNGNSAGRL